MRARFERVDTGQEDWGWGIWFARGPVRLLIHITCDDAETGDYTVRLTSTLRRGWRGLFGMREDVDTPELGDLKALVLAALEGWTDTPCEIHGAGSSTDA